MAWLNDHPPKRSQFRHPRRSRPSGVIAVHTAENTPDTVAFDGGAEAVANFIRNRSDYGSYHDLCDSDSCINLVDYDDEAYHDGTGTNRHSYGLSVATRADVWPLAPAAWRSGAVEQAAQAAARYARWGKDRYGITIPARRITADQARAGVPGFVTHAQLDPGRRSDPGAGFPWAQFLARFAELTDQEDDMPSIDEVKNAVREVLDEGAGFGVEPPTWAQTQKDRHKTLQDQWQRGVNTLLLLREVAGKVDVDEAALAEHLAPLIEATIPSLSADDLARIAKAVADEDHRRSKD